MRIIQVVNVRWFNATAWYGLFLSKLLSEAGHHVCVLTLKDTDPFDRAMDWGLHPTALPLNVGNPFAIATLFARLRRLIHIFRPHVVNCHRGESFFLWAALRHMSYPFALVRTRGDQRPPKADALNRLLHTQCADAVIATSCSITRTLEERLQIPAERLHTIFGGVDTRIFKPFPEEALALRNTWNIRPDEQLIGLVGRFDTVKGQKELIAAYARFLADGGETARKTRLVLAGFGTSSTGQSDIRRWASDAGISEKLVLPGKVLNVPALMSALDLGVVASLGSETIARVALEIMACGTPLVGTRVGVMPDLLTPEALVTPGNIDETAAILHRFTNDNTFGQNLRTQQSERMRTLGERDFYSQTLAAYHQAMTHVGIRQE